jgi:hypothetical protein
LVFTVLNAIMGFHNTLRITGTISPLGESIDFCKTAVGVGFLVTTTDGLIDFYTGLVELDLVFIDTVLVTFFFVASDQQTKSTHTQKDPSAFYKL